MIEWLTTSHFSFTEGASSPIALFEHAVHLGYKGLGLADRMSQSGLVRALDGATRARELLPDFFFAPGIRLHFDVADPLFVYPLHRKAHGDLCRFLSSWALAGLPEREKGLTPLRWRNFLKFLQERKPHIARDYVLIAVSGRFFPWVEAETPAQKSRVRTQDAQAPEPSFSAPPNHPGHTPFWLLELRDVCGGGDASALSLAYPTLFIPGAEQLLDWTEEHSRKLEIPLLATRVPLFAHPNDQELCELVTAIRHSKPLAELGYLRQANRERCLADALRRNFERRLVRERFGRLPQTPNDPFQRSLDLAERHHFSLHELRYRYPRERISATEEPAAYFRRLVWEGAARRYPDGCPPEVRSQIEHELTLIANLEYEDYFLTIYDVLEYARTRKILFQGRGSAANSAVCFCLGITAIDPVQMGLLFERFLSMERKEPPDIDVDFEHERREEVLQEIYRRYGREHAAMVSTYICFRGRMAVRETGKAIGLTPAQLEALGVYMGRESLSRISELTPELTKYLQDAGITVAQWRQLLRLAEKLKGAPRHLSIHTGGFVLSSEVLSEQCVLEPARKEERSVIPWDKDDVDYLKWMKVDFLSLGMLTAIRKTFDGIRQTQNRTVELATVPHDCPDVYASFRRADTVGVFQIESRAQMNMLPRLAPRNFYDVVVEVAIVRPGPLQGGMVHPYIRRRQGLEPVTYAHPDLEPILKKTLGVSIFQEQVMKMASAIAGFTPGEADLLRKAMSGAWRSKSQMHTLQEKLQRGMRAKGVNEDMIGRIYKQIEGFGEYGFPESHAASFALLTYVSGWLKVHHPAEFLCALLNSQPMGFYAPRALVGDAERHGVRVLPIDLLYSRWDSTLEKLPTGAFGVRLGMHLISAFSKGEAERIEDWQRRGFLDPTRPPTVSQLLERGFPWKSLKTCIQANACRSFARPSNEDSVPNAPTRPPPTNSSVPNIPSRRSANPTDLRRAQTWELLGRKHVAGETLPLHRNSPDITPAAFDTWTALLKDYSAVGLTPGRHPIPYARETFFKSHGAWKKAESLYLHPVGAKCRILGLLSIKQKPPTAGGLTFLTLEDETGFFNLVVMPDVYEKRRLTLEQSRVLAADVVVQKSAPSDPGDIRTSAVSLLVQDLWNPFLKVPVEEGRGVGEMRYKPRHYH